MRWLLSLCVLALTACTTGIPVVRDVDMKLSGALGGHLYPPDHYVEDIDSLREGVVIKRVPGHEVGPRCNLFGNVWDLFVAECVRTFEDGSTLMLLPTCPAFATEYCAVSERHGWGHVYQAKNGLPMDHKGWSGVP